MDLGIHVVGFDFPGGADAIGPTLAEVGRVADEAGIANLSFMDHYLQLEMMGGPTGPMLEGYTALGFVAGLTSRIELQLLVTGVTYRHPGLLAKIVTTLDVLSGGRAALGIGAAWYEREHQALGVPYPAVSERFERLEETLEIVHRMWGEGTGPYDGRHYQLAETLCSPRPIRRPHPPIMVGGSGERKTLRLVAKYADACNFFAGGEQGPDLVAAKLAVLREHCTREGRDPADIRITTLHTGPLDVGTSAGGAAFVADMARYAAVGVSEVHVMPMHNDPVAFATGLGDHVVDGLRALGPAAP